MVLGSDSSRRGTYFKVLRRVRGTDRRLRRLLTEHRYAHMGPCKLGQHRHDQCVRSMSVHQKRHSRWHDLLVERFAVRPRPLTHSRKDALALSPGAGALFLLKFEPWSADSWGTSTDQRENLMRRSLALILALAALLPTT